MANTGELNETKGEVTLEWKLKDFYSLSQETNAHYDSETFHFSGISWEIWIYPNGQAEGSSDRWIGLYIKRVSTGFPITVNYSLSLKTADGKNDPCITSTNAFPEKYIGWGNSNFISRSALEERKSDLTPSDTLTVVCTLKNSQPNAISRSLFSRQSKIIDTLREAYVKAKRTDLTLKVEGKNIAAHRMILEARSSVFTAMFNHDTKENKTGEVSIIDVDKSTMETILINMYTGDIDNPTTENVLPLYAAAEKYDIKDIKEICSDFIIRNLSVDWVCDVIEFAELYQEEEIGGRARQYFKENARKVLKTEKWKTFAKENHALSVELLGYVVEAMLPD